MTGITGKIFTHLSDLLVSPVADFADGVALSISSPILHRSNNTLQDGDAVSSGLYRVIYMSLIFSTILVLGLLLLALKRLHHLLFVPLDRVRRLGSIGYINHEAGDMTRRELANLIRQRRKTGDDLPPIYPNGWFRLVDSVQLKRKEVKQVHALGQNFAVYRGESGRASVMDAYCAHMGGNLAVGGRVIGDCLECPFHGWQYDEHGKCVKIPYASKVPEFAKVKVWPSREVNGVVFVWYHCEGIEPTWEIPVISKIKNGTFKYRGRVEHHANTHIQDIPENGSDLAHLAHLHLPSVFCGVNLAEQFDSWMNFADHVFRVKVKGVDPDRPHVSCFDMTHHIDLLKRFQFLKLNINVEQIGPGIVHLHMELPFGHGVFVQTLTPVGPLHQVLIHSFYTDWKCPTWLSKIFLSFEGMQVDRDIMIWNNKTFSAKPLLVKEDAAIAKYRRWFAQFYTENSPKLEMKQDDGIQW